MLVKVYLNGSMGKEFGREWKLAINSPREALALIEANTGRLFGWMRANLQKYSAYKVLCVFKNGKREYLTKDTLLTAHNIKELRFTPVIKGAGAVGRIVAGVVLMVAAVWLGPIAFQAGMALALGGVSELLAPKPKTPKDGDTKTSHYFQGATNTAEQGSPVPLIYGRCKVGSVPASVKLTIGEVATYKGPSSPKDYLHGRF